MALVMLIEASPEDSSGTVVPVRMAGGGSRGYAHKGHTDWLAGIANRPLRKAAIGYDEKGWTGESRASTLDMVYSASSRARISNVGRLIWKNARVVVSVGDDEDAQPTFTPAIIGLVTGFAIDGADAKLTITDLSAELDIAAAPGTFAGTGGIEGDEAALGRVKRRSWGSVFDIEGRLLNAANNIYEFGDPEMGLLTFREVRDIGRAWSGAGFVAYQGSAQATLDALKASSPPVGGGVIAPSIGCVKWWTQPNSPLCADLIGAVYPNASEAIGHVARHVLRFYPTNIVVPDSEIDKLNAARPGNVGIHVDGGGETVRNVLDRLLLGASSLWVVDFAGNMRFRTWTFDNPVEAMACEAIGRLEQLAPHLRRKVGYQRNHRVHSPGEISAAIVSTDVYYVDGTPIETLKPLEANANVTETRQAASFAGQRALATKDQVDFSSSDVANRIAQHLPYGYFQPSVLDLKPQEAGANVTEYRQASSFAGQRALATKDAVDFNSGEVANRLADYLSYGFLQPSVKGLQPQEVGANVTEYRQAATIAGQGALATKSRADTLDLTPNATASAGLLINPNAQDGSGVAPSTADHNINVNSFTYTAPTGMNVTVIVSAKGSHTYTAQADYAASLQVDGSEVDASYAGVASSEGSWTTQTAFVVGAGTTRTVTQMWRGSSGIRLLERSSMLIQLYKSSM